MRNLALAILTLLALLPSVAFAAYDVERDKLIDQEARFTYEMSRACGRRLKFNLSDFISHDEALQLERDRSLTWECRYLAEQLIQACTEVPTARDNLKNLTSIMCRRASLGRRKFEVTAGQIRWYVDVISTSYKIDAKEEIREQLYRRFQLAALQKAPKQVPISALPATIGGSLKQGAAEFRSCELDAWYETEREKIETSEMKPADKRAALDRLDLEMKKKTDNAQK